MKTSAVDDPRSKRYVCPTTRHVSGDGDVAGMTRASNDLRLLTIVPCVENRVLDAVRGEAITQLIGVCNRVRTDQHRAVLRGKLAHAFDHSIPFLLPAHVDSKRQRLAQGGFAQRHPTDG